MQSKSLTHSNFIKILLISLTLLLLGQAGSLQAAGEDDNLLSPDFGAGFNGTGYLRINPNTYAVAVQPDGKIVVGGTKKDDFWLARYNTDGTLDTGFGQNGQVFTPFSPSKSDTVLGLAIQPPFGQKIVAVGHAEDRQRTAIAQYTADGQLVFQRTLNFEDGRESASSVVFQPDGKIVLGGEAEQDSCPGPFTCYDNNFAFARLNRDGTPDDSFDGEGRQMVGLGGEDGINTVLVQADDKILGIGNKTDSFDYDERVGMVRLTPNGRLDPTLDHDGKFSSAHIGWGLDGLIQADGKIVVATGYGKMVRYHPDSSVDKSFGPDGLIDLTTPAGAFIDKGSIQIEVGVDGNLLIAGQIESGDQVVVRYTPQGYLDPSFNAGQGYARLPINDFVRDMAVGPDGKIVILQRSNGTHLTRLLPDGRLDQGEGRAFTNLGDSFEQISDAILQADGKIVVTGHYNVPINNRPQERWVIARYTDGGHLDTEFGQAGLITEPDILSRGRAVAIDRQGRVLVAGLLFGNTGELILRRYNPDGSPAFFPAAPDRRWPVFDTGSGLPSSWEIVVQPDDKIVLAGTHQDGDRDFALLRYLDNGAPDPSFDNDGLVTTDFGEPGGDDSIGGLALQPDGKLVVTGSTRPPDGTAKDDQLALARYRPDGSLDLDFGDGDGKIVSPVHGGYSALALQPDGKIVTGGTVNQADGRRVFGALRFTAAGALDLTFNSSGQSLVDFGQDALAVDLVLEPDGVISLTGCVVGGQVDPFAMVRLRSNGRPDVSFSDDGRATFQMSQTNACAYSIVREATGGDYILAGYGEVTPADSQLAMVRIKGRGLDNQPPLAQPNNYTTSQETPLTIAAPGVLDNDGDPEGKPLSARLVSSTDHGELSLDGDGSFEYTPDPGFNGTDGFSYRASDSFEFSEPVTVTIEVSAGPGPNPTPNPTPGGDFTVFLPLVMK